MRKIAPASRNAFTVNGLQLTVNSSQFTVDSYQSAQAHLSTANCQPSTSPPRHTTPIIPLQPDNFFPPMPPRHRTNKRQRRRIYSVPNSSKPVAVGSSRPVRGSEQTVSNFQPKSAEATEKPRQPWVPYPGNINNSPAPPPTHHLTSSPVHHQPLKALLRNPEPKTQNAEPKLTTSSPHQQPLTQNPSLTTQNPSYTTPDELISRAWRYQPDLFRFCLSLGLQTADAEDMAMDILLRAREKWQLFRGGNLRSWLLRICHTQVISRHRQHICRRTNLVDEVPDGIALATPISYIAVNELQTDLEKAYRTLSALHRRAHAMRMDGMKYDEIAQELSVTQTEARRLYREARKSLLKLLPREKY